MAQIIETARGSLVARLNKLPLAYGELFIHTSGTIDEVAIQAVLGHNIKDLTTETDIKKIFTGDLFAGHNSSEEVYSLGSGNSLKWGGLLIGTWSQIKTEVKKNPNFIYMYQGDDQVINTSSSKHPDNSNIKETADDPDIIIIGKYVANTSNEYYDEINPGDLVFFSPVKNHIVVIHLNHSSDALVKLNVEKLISDSIRNQFEKIAEGDETSGGKNKATLKTFLDGPARYYQQLAELEGWKPLAYTKVTKTSAYGKELTEVATAYIASSNGVGEEPVLGTDDGDGWIHYMPFVDGRQKIENPFADETSSKQPEFIYEGDLILSLPTIGGKVRHVVVSLYGELLKRLNPGDVKIQRADTYADEIYSDHDGALIETAESIKSFIEDLYTTKVDIDPITKKIISSQLPDYILGTLKYQGLVTDDNITDVVNNTETEEGGTATATAKDLLDYLIDLTTGTKTDIKDASDADGNGDKKFETEEALSADVDTIGKDTDEKIKVGSYWIYQGKERFVIDGYGNLFNLENTTADKTEDNNTTGDDFDGTSFVHALNPGDWIIWNGDKFDIIDNSSTFLGLLIHGIKCSGLVEFTTPTRKLEETNFDAEVLNGASTEVQVKATGESQIEFNAANAVLFKDEGAEKSLVDENHIPVITDTGWVINSRFKFIDGEKYGDTAGSGKQIGLQISATLSGENGAVPSTTLIFRDLYKDYSKSIATELVKTWEEFELMAGFVRSGEEETSKYFTGSTEGFSYGDISYILGKDPIEDYYSFQIESEANVKLQLPLHSGILATEQYVNAGFVVTKKLVEDAVALLEYKTTAGHVDWLQTIIEYESGGVTSKRIYDSKILQEYKEGVSLFLDLFFLKPETPGEKDGKYSQLRVMNELDNTYENGAFGHKLGFKENGTDGLDYELGGYTFNPSKYPKNGVVENVLPNHSGILINSNSVIDGGYYI